MDTEYLEFNNNDASFFTSYGGTRKKEKNINSLSKIYTTNNKRLKTIDNVGKISDFSVQNNSLKVNQEVSHERFGFYQEVQSDSLGNTQSYSIFQNGIYGSPGKAKSGNISFNLANLLEAKVPTKNDSLKSLKTVGTSFFSIGLTVPYSLIDSFFGKRYFLSNSFRLISGGQFVYLVNTRVSPLMNLFI